LYSRFDMPDAHGDVPPVEDMFDIAADGISSALPNSFVGNRIQSLAARGSTKN
jgi:hypothetical protein